MPEKLVRGDVAVTFLELIMKLGSMDMQRPKIRNWSM